MLSFAAHPQTKNNLLKLVNGDNQLCQRLVNKIKNQYPERHEQWCYQKAIDDLIKDRR